MNKVSKILVYGLKFIGDSLFTTAFLKNLRLIYPDAFITVLCGKKGADIVLQNNKNINSAMVLDDDSTQRIEFIKNGNFDIAFILNTSFKAAYEVYKAGVKIRVGHKKELRGFLLTHKVKFDNKLHYAENHLNLFKHFIGKDVTHSNLEMFPENLHRNNIETILKNVNPENKTIAVLVPGTTNIKKSWPISNYFEVNSLLIDKGFFTITIGSKFDNELCGNINPECNLCGKTCLHELYILFSKSKLVLTPDTGPMHIAACLENEDNKPYIIALFGPTSPLLYGPYNYSQSVILQKPSKKVDDILVSDVMHEISTLKLV